MSVVWQVFSDPQTLSVVEVVPSHDVGLAAECVADLIGGVTDDDDDRLVARRRAPAAQAADQVKAPLVGSSSNVVVVDKNDVAHDNSGRLVRSSLGQDRGDTLYC